MKTTINDIEYYLPERTETNEELTQKNPDWNMDLITPKTGIYTRHIAEKNETSLDLGIKACNKLLSLYPELCEKIDAILFCTVTADYQFPQNSYMVHKQLKLPSNIFCLDISLACSGFVYSMAVAHGLIQARIAKNILIINAETYSKYINEKDRSIKCLFSDGAAATWVQASDSCRGLIDIDLGSLGSGYDAAWIPAGMSRTPLSSETSQEKKDHSGNIRTLEQIYMDGKRTLAMVGSLVPKQVKHLVKRNNLIMDDIDLFVFHQASKLVLDSLEKLLRIKPEKNFRNLCHVGNTSSASIPIALKDALRTNQLKKGDTVLVSGFGAGFSCGTAILEI